MSFECEETVLILDEMVNLDKTELPFGKRWGGQLVRLTPAHLEALQAGKFLAIDDQNEYVVYLALEKDKS
ncbi:hypothetical protein [Iodobacter fluviatilis]|uniref:Uncharacterized protein n=1 Tax=Iodobacter fluviatilis TaxID=537 RepID=A0A7G3G6J5_9NEIS|nr:hypothetical protein [Iodobacter fluviatilis]MCX7207370.1 hypothetical protein [Pseudomonadota bacterium]QBC42896.1 hypothetical protein C1H71_04585 [Iodobacter fluviatilis]